MNISFGIPLSKGWDRMKKALFHPFDLGKWFTIGFAAFLAGLASCQGSSGGNYSRRGKNLDWDGVLSFPQTAWDWLISHPLYFVLIVFGAIVVFTIVIVLTWLSSRGKFMLLYNVVTEKAEISKPWGEFRKEGNSLFLWRFVFGLFATSILVLLLIYCFGIVKSLHLNDAEGAILVWGILKMVILFIGYSVIIGYINLFLNDFVVPIMYKHRVSATQGWVIFFQILWRYLGYFIVYGLFIFVLTIGVVISIVIACICTCCIGFLLLIIPYINSVVLLPITYTYRAFSVEFLEQFGDNFHVFPRGVEIITETVEP
jgi:hypothetical protein